MKFHTLLQIVRECPVFETGLLLAGAIDPADVRRQLSRWTRAGKIVQLRRRVYALAPPYGSTPPDPFLVANRLVPGSYVSLQSALAHHGLIPEQVPVVTSVTSRRPGHWRTPLGTFVFRHVRSSLLDGYDALDVPGGGTVFVASAEKALLDLLYLEPGSESPAYLEGLRLQGLEGVDPARLEQLSHLFHSPKIDRAVRWLLRQRAAQTQEYGPP